MITVTVTELDGIWYVQRWNADALVFRTRDGAVTAARAVAEQLSRAIRLPVRIVAEAGGEYTVHTGSRHLSAAA